MDYVSKKDFEAAITVIERALKNDQIEEGCSHLTLNLLLFGHSDNMDHTSSPKQISFIPSDMAAKNKLHLLRQELKLSRETLSTSQKTLEKLEKEEQVLIALLPKLKE